MNDIVNDLYAGHDSFTHKIFRHPPSSPADFWINNRGNECGGEKCTFRSSFQEGGKRRCIPGIAPSLYFRLPCSTVGKCAAWSISTSHGARASRVDRRNVPRRDFLKIPLNVVSYFERHVDLQTHWYHELTNHRNAGTYSSFSIPFTSMYSTHSLVPAKILATSGEDWSTVEGLT